MQEEQKYNVVYAGDVVKGFNVSDVKTEFNTQLNVSAKQVEKLFAGKKVVLKKSIDRKKAEKFQQKLLNIGAEVAIVPLIPSPAKSSTPNKLISPTKPSSAFNSSSQEQYDEEMNARILKAKAMIASHQLEQQIRRSKEPAPFQRLLIFSSVLGVVLVIIYFYLKSIA